MQVLGEGVSEWAEVSPPEVQVYPEQEATAVVVFSPPAGNTTRSGSFPFAVRAESVVDPACPRSPRATWRSAGFSGCSPRSPRSPPSGRWRGKHFIEDHQLGQRAGPVEAGGARTRTRSSAFLVGPEIMDLPLGVTGHAQLRVRTLAPFLRGCQVRMPFQVVAEPDPPEVGHRAAVDDPEPAARNPGRRVRATPDPVQADRRRWRTLLVVAIGGTGGVPGHPRCSDEGPAGLAQGSPRTPALSAVGRGPTSVQLLWEPQPNIQNYRINQLTTDGRTAGVVTVDGALTTFVVEPLASDAEFCFQLQAVRGDQLSPLSETQCARTGVAPPTAASPTRRRPRSARRRSRPRDRRRRLSSDAPGPRRRPSSTVGREPGRDRGPARRRRRCQRFSDGSTGRAGAPPRPPPAVGPPDPPHRAVDKASPRASTSVVVFTIPAADAEAAGRAEFRRQQFIAGGRAGRRSPHHGLPETQLVPGLTPVDSYLVYVGPFASAQEAQARCAAQPSLGSLCRPVEPNPAG